MVQWEQEGTTIGYTASDEAYLRGFLSECFLVARDAGRIVGFLIAGSPGESGLQGQR